MYLEKKTYIKNWSYMDKKDHYKITITKGGKKREDIDTSKINYIVEEAGYWRKANAIHAWFVANCGDNKDECQIMYVGETELRILLDNCNKIIKGCKLIKGKVVTGQKIVNGKFIDQMEDGKVMTNPKLAQKLLPTQEGSFFGNTNYDEWYMNTIKETKKIIEEALKSIDNGAEIYYQASW